MVKLPKYVRKLLQNSDGDSACQLQISPVDDNDKTSDERIEKFLLSELDAMETELQRLRTEGANRVTSLLTMTTTLLGAALLIGRLPNATERDVIVAVLIVSGILFVYGLITYEYVVSRDILSDAAARGTGRVRHYFVAKYPEITPHVSWQDVDSPTHWIANNKSEMRRTVELLVACIIGLPVGLIIYLDYKISAISAILLALIVSGCAWLLLRIYSGAKYARAAQNARATSRFPKTE